MGIAAEGSSAANGSDPMGASEAGVLDVRVLDQVREAVGGDSAFLADLVEAYRLDGAAQLVAMRNALAQGETAALVRAAHSLKSNSAGLGALALADLCRELETAVRTGALNGSDAHAGATPSAHQGPPGAPTALRVPDGTLERLEHELGRVTRALAHVVESDRSGGTGT
jgi:HPt (histidine-containing phosphotransfer) domain-containing protein